LIWVTSSEERSSMGMWSPLGMERSKVEDGRGDVKRNVVFLGENGDLVSADFVGGVAVGGDAVGSGDDAPTFPVFRKWPTMFVRDERERNVAAMKFPRGEARRLGGRGAFSGTKT